MMSIVFECIQLNYWSHIENIFGAIQKRDAKKKKQAQESLQNIFLYTNTSNFEAILSYEWNDVDDA